jgi:hypothetical protein
MHLDQLLFPLVSELDLLGGICVFFLSSNMYIYTDKKENQIFLIYKEIQNGAVAKSYMTNGLLIYGTNICAFPHILGSPSSYMTLQLLHSEFPYI